MNISIFQNAKNTVPIDILTIDDFIAKVKHGVWQNVVEKIRNAKSKEEKTAFKILLPAVTVSGTFHERKESGLIQHSGFVQIDIDHDISKFDDLCKDQYTYAVFKSAGGNGLVVIVKINKEKHKESIRFLRDYYFNTYKIFIDDAPVNVASLRFVSFDPNAFINEKSKVSKQISEKKVKPKSLNLVFGNSEVDGLVQEIQRSGISIAPSYEEYRNLAFALADGFGENGRDYFHALCFNDSNYKQRDSDKQFDEALKGRKSGISVGTFYYMVQNAGFQLPKVNQAALNTAVIGKSNNLSVDLIAQNLVNQYNFDLKNAEEFAKKVIEDQNITLASVSGDADKLIETLISWLNKHYEIKLNTITRILEDKGDILTQRKLNSIFLKAKKAFNIPALTYDILERIIFSEEIPEFNPFEEYFKANSYRESNGNLDKLCKTIDSYDEIIEFTSIFIKKWFVSLIAATDGYPIRSVLALVGGQNTGKTEWFRRLLPKNLQKYYAESKMDAGKDDDLLMTQKLIVMNDEMGGKSKQDEKRFKELTSKAIFSLRAPYGRNNEDFKRLAVLCGTSNDKEVINDPTGNTRMLPVEVFSINHDLYNSIDKDELFMEAKRLYDKGFDYKLSKKELEFLDKFGGLFQAINQEYEAINKFFMQPVKDPKGNYIGFVEFMTATDIKDVIEQHSKIQIRNMKKFGIELKKFFGDSRGIKRNGSTVYCYDVQRI